MPARLPGLAAYLAAALAAGACTDATRHQETGSGASIEVTDAAGVVHTMDAPARRIVSLVPSATQTLEALGAESLLVGRTDFDRAAWAQDIPSVGGGIHPSGEELVALAPDLVVRFAGDQDVETPALLNRLGIRHLAIRPDRIEDVRASILLLGAVTGHDDEAAGLSARIDAEINAVRSASRRETPLRVAYVLGGSPPWVAGPGTFVQEIVEIAGGTNVFADLDRLYASVSPEEFVARDIQVILTPDAATLPPLVAAAAPVVEIGDLLELPGPELGHAASEVARLLAEVQGR